MTKKTNLLARRLKQARIAAGLSQKALGKRLHLSDKTVSAYEQGRAMPPFDTLQRIGQATQKSVTFFTEEGLQRDAELQARLQQIEQELAEVRQVLQVKGLL